MVTRKALISLAVFTLVCFAVAGIIGNHRHGLVMTVGDIAWTGMLLGLLFLLVGSAAAIVRSRRRLGNG
jgi:branched-subunit amino acid permease